jgi:hypothetical protein
MNQKEIKIINDLFDIDPQKRTANENKLLNKLYKKWEKEQIIKEQKAWNSRQWNTI